MKLVAFLAPPCMISGSSLICEVKIVLPSVTVAVSTLGASPAT